MARPGDYDEASYHRPGPDRTPSGWMGKSIPLSEVIGEAWRHGGSGPGVPGSRPTPQPPPVPAQVRKYQIHDLRRLDAVVHGFLANLDPMQVQTPTHGSVRANTARFRRVLDYQPRSSSPPLGPPVLCGISPVIGLESLLGFLGSMRKTGILRVHADDTTFLISIVRGDVVHGISDPRPEQELLGNILLARGRVESEQLARFFEDCGPSPFRVGDALNHERLVSTEVLRGALEFQLRLLFDRLLAARTAEWCFHEGEASSSYVDLCLNATSMLLESARKRDEDNQR